MTIVTMMIRLFLSVILCRAALHKLRDVKTFQAELAAYRLLPTLLLPITTILLIAAEILTAISLLNIAWIVPAFAAAVLFFVYALAMTINLLKGRTHIDCGCTGPLLSSKERAKKTISWSLVIRNLVLTSLALLCTTYFTIEATIEHNGALELFIILAGTVISLLLYETTEQAIANTQGYQRWTH